MSRVRSSTKHAKASRTARMVMARARPSNSTQQQERHEHPLNEQDQPVSTEYGSWEFIYDEDRSCDCRDGDGVEHEQCARCDGATGRSNKAGPDCESMDHQGNRTNSSGGIRIFARDGARGRPSSGGRINDQRRQYDDQYSNGDNDQHSDGDDRRCRVVQAASPTDDNGSISEDSRGYNSSVSPHFDTDESIDGSECSIPSGSRKPSTITCRNYSGGDSMRGRDVGSNSGTSGKQFSDTTTQVDASVWATHNDDQGFEKYIVTRGKAPTSVHCDGFHYTWYHTSSKQSSYLCKSWRGGKNKPKCPAKLHFVIEAMRYEREKEHVCKEVLECSPRVVDVSEEMKVEADRLAVAHLGLKPTRIWEALCEMFFPAGVDIVQTGLSFEQVARRVKDARRSHLSDDIYGLVEVPPLSLVSGSSMPFFQFQSTYVHGKDKERMIGWAHPHLVERLQFKNTTIFIDGTFRCVPKDFYQCVIVMVHDAATDIFLPVFYTLCTSKTQETNWNLLHAIIGATDERLQPEVVICDFEQALQDAVKVQFSDADIIGCYFHFKQAIRRKMKKISIPRPEIEIAMSRGYVDLLTVLPQNKIAGPGVRYVRRAIEQRCRVLALQYSSVKWEQFWLYFTKTWIERFPPRVWNVHGINRSLVSRTNNSLERFNRTINDAIGASHPSLPRFVAVIDELSKDYSRQLDDVASRRRSRKRRRREQEEFLLPDEIDLHCESDEGSASCAPNPTPASNCQASRTLASPSATSSRPRRPHASPRPQEQPPHASQRPREQPPSRGPLRRGSKTKARASNIGTREAVV